MIGYFITCFQCAFQTTLTFQRLIHFTDWVVAHAHLVMFGVFSFWIIGMMVYLWPKLCNAPWWSDRLNGWVYWIMTISLIAMFLDLTIAGVVEGYLWQTLAPWERSLTAAQPFWHTRTITGIGVITATSLQIYNMWMTARSRASASTPLEGEPAVAAG
jgi:cytochrome c oxidase cbb3-type subunit 1